MNNISNPENHLHTVEPKWFAVYTRYKREKVVHDELNRKGIDSFLPLQKILRQYGRKKRWIELPLFNSYVFVKIVKAEYVPVLSTEGVVQFIHFSKNLISIPDSEIELIQRIIGAEISVEVEEGFFESGDKVEIIAGGLTGVRGILIETQGKHKVLVELNHLGYTLRLELPANILRILSSVRVV